MKYIKYW